MSLFNAEKRATRREETVQDLEVLADQHTDKALRNLRARRAWIVREMALPTAKLGGHAFDDEMSKAAHELYYLDTAIRSLSD